MSSVNFSAHVSTCLANIYSVDYTGLLGTLIDSIVRNRKSGDPRFHRLRGEVVFHQPQAQMENPPTRRYGYDRHKSLQASSQRLTDSVESVTSFFFMMAPNLPDYSEIHQKTDRSLFGTKGILLSGKKKQHTIRKSQYFPM